MRAQWTPKDRLKEDVWVALEFGGTAGRTIPELMGDTGFSREQVKSGLREINRDLQRQKRQPIMVMTGTWRYVLPEFYGELLPWNLNRLGDMRTRLQTERVRLLAADDRWPGDVPPSLHRQIDRLIEDLDDLLQDVEASGTAQRRTVRIRKPKGK